jgi:DNA-binding NarL/FixJ family response regulator
MTQAQSALVASGDRLLAEAARRYLERKGWTVVATALDGLQALAAMARHAPSAVLILSELPRLGPSGLARQLQRRSQGVTVVIVGESNSSDATVLAPDVNGNQILAALAAPPSAAGPRPGKAERPDGVTQLRNLTARERAVLKLLAEGLPPAAIASRLEVRQNTIRTHMQNLYAKLGAHSRLDVVRFAAQNGLVRDPDGLIP